MPFILNLVFSIQGIRHEVHPIINRAYGQFNWLWERKQRWQPNQRR